MCGGHSYPAPGAGLIVGLKPGDEIILKAGFGHPTATSRFYTHYRCRK